MNTWLFIRHGESAANVAQWFSGQIDVELTAVGVNQAMALGKLLKAQHIDRVYASDLSRARRTAEIALGGRGLEMTLDRRLRERHCGVYQGQSVQDLKENGGYDTLMAFDGRPNEGESLRDVAIRAAEYLGSLPVTNQVIAVVCHGALIRSLVGVFDGRTFDRISDWKPNNCQVISRVATTQAWMSIAERLRSDQP